MKKRISKRSAFLYSQLLLSGFKKTPLVKEWDKTHYGVTLIASTTVFIHKHKAKFSLENAKDWLDLNEDSNIIIKVSKINKNTFFSLLEYLAENS